MKSIVKLLGALLLIAMTAQIGSAGPVVYTFSTNSSFEDFKGTTFETATFELSTAEPVTDESLRSGSVSFDLLSGSVLFNLLGSSISSAAVTGETLDWISLYRQQTMPDLEWSDLVGIGFTYDFRGRSGDLGQLSTSYSFAFPLGSLTANGTYITPAATLIVSGFGQTGVPEPASILLLGTGLALIGCRARRGA